jgi:5-(aminomethyl)-3-furanmethanol phosphate kinase
VSAPQVVVEVVVKIGGGLLARTRALERVTRELPLAARRGRLLVVPGGGPFADAVRHADRSVGLSDDAAHWMAVLGMEQYAHLLASRIATARLVERHAEIAAALDERCLPVLAPYRWLREADPLPHSWEVTSDSIAAWVAGEVGARRLVLIKPVGGDVSARVDSYFERALPSRVQVEIVAAEELNGDRLIEPLM